jgi:hypothetical protein
MGSTTRPSTRVRIAKALVPDPVIWALRDSRIDAFVVSHPKSGRTWVRLLLRRALAVRYGGAEVDPFGRLPAGAPKVRFTHDRPYRTARAESNERSRYRGKRIVFLARDPRDIVVSSYYSRTKRSQPREAYTGDLETLIDSERGFDRILDFLNVWARNQHVPAAFLLVRYEDLHADTGRELRRILDFIGVQEVDDAIVDDAVDFASFDNLRKIEEAGEPRPWLVPGIPGDETSYKTRRGKVGGYVDEIAPAHIALLTDKMRSRLDPTFGYNT